MATLDDIAREVGKVKKENMQLRAENEKIKTAFSEFAVNVMTTAIMGIADGAIVSNKVLDETDALKAVQELSEACISYRKENAKLWELLKESEWASFDWDKQREFCWCCKALAQSTWSNAKSEHAPDCALAAALKEKKP